jgi:hypothetical protein
MAFYQCDSTGLVKRYVDEVSSDLNGPAAYWCATKRVMTSGHPIVPVTTNQ